MVGVSVFGARGSGTQGEGPTWRGPDIGRRHQRLPGPNARNIRIAGARFNETQNGTVRNRTGRAYPLLRGAGGGATSGTRRNPGSSGAPGSIMSDRRTLAREPRPLVDTLAPIPPASRLGQPARTRNLETVT